MSIAEAPRCSVALCNIANSLALGTPPTNEIDVELRDLTFHFLFCSCRFFSRQEATSMDTIMGVLHFRPSSSSRFIIKSSTKSVALSISSDVMSFSCPNRASTRLLRHSISSGSSSSTRNSSGVFIQLVLALKWVLFLANVGEQISPFIGSSCSRTVATTRWLSATRPAMQRSMRPMSGPASPRPSKRSTSRWQSRAWRSMKKRFVSLPYTMRIYQSTRPSASFVARSPPAASSSDDTKNMSCPSAFCSREHRSITGMNSGRSIVEWLRQCMTSLQSKHDFPEPGSPTMRTPWKKRCVVILSSSSEMRAWTSDQKKTSRPASSAVRGTGPSSTSARSLVTV
mmetsp:Transcript_88219/g.249996  ORF Transcript_88219/g.249996 Transcript_88219/m.249996 type:complete len:341 (-) Transcript_88219:1222-2244(-)